MVRRSAFGRIRFGFGLIFVFLPVVWLTVIIMNGLQTLAECRVGIGAILLIVVLHRSVITNLIFAGRRIGLRLHRRRIVFIRILISPALLFR